MKKRKLIGALLCGIVATALFTGCGSKGGENGVVYVYNWGEYIDPETIEMFEEETGIKVEYEEYETNEIMYPKVAAGTSNYDLLCPSDYMITKLMENDMLAELNFDHMPNALA